jgi:hypothetical protein
MIGVLRERLRLISWIVSVAAVAAAGWFVVDRSVAFSATSASAGDPVVLELFTSQSCSSCPPADALLSQLGSSTKGVIPLAYHVDYWNNLGWSDSFSSHQFSERQTDYARAMNLDGEYTPQLVIGGGWQAVGSEKLGVEHGIEAARSVAALGRVTIHLVPLTPGSQRLQLKVNAHVLKDAGTAPLVVMLAIYENGLVTKIGGGENGGHEIAYDYTVRRLLPAFELDPTQGASSEKDLTVNLDPSWSVNHLGVAAFIQDTISLRIVGAASQYPIARN